MYRVAAIGSALFFAFLLWVIYLANTGADFILFDLIRTIPYGDKIGHFCLFGLLTLGVNTALKFNTLNFIILRIYVGTLLVTIFVVGEELSQYFIPTRTLDAGDLLADAAGILVFTTASYLLAAKLNHSA